MKKLSFIIAILFMGKMLFAQKPIDSKGRVIDVNGNVYISGTKLGSVSKDSIVKNAQGKQIAFLESGGVLVDTNGKILGRVGKDGQTFYNTEGNAILKVKDNTDSETCDIMDANGKVIGNVHNNYKAMACTLHCFSNGMNAKTHQKSIRDTEHSTDLVCNMKVNKSEAYTYKYKDVEYFFDSKNCKEVFKMNPEKFLKN